MSASDTSESDEVRILQSISDSKSGNRRSAARVKGKRGRKTIIAVVLLLVACAAAAVAFYVASPTQHGSMPTTQLAVNAPAPAVVGATGTTGAALNVEHTEHATSVADHAATASTSDAAVINDMSPPEPAVAGPATSPDAEKQHGDALAKALEDGVKPPSATLKKALEAKPEKQKPVKRPAAHEEKKKAVAKNESKSDSDVDLIKALVARSSEVDKKRAAREEAPGAPTQKLAQNNAASSSRATGARNVDMVERTGAESTQSLLQRCRALGFVEGELCRWRICSGRWDSDPACKASSANAN